MGWKKLKAIFAVKSIENQWKPPFRKTIEDKELTVSENESFEKFDGREENVFKLLKVGADNVVIEYHREFTLKNYQQPSSKQLQLELNEPQSFTFLWGEDGITKTLTLKQTVQ